jgi:hypothetical protein
VGSRGKRYNISINRCNTTCIADAVLMPHTAAAAAVAAAVQNSEHTGDPITYAKNVQKTARLTEFVGLTVLGTPGTEPSAAAAADSGPSSSSSSSSEDDAFLKFTVRWRQRGVGGPEELATETSHFKRVNGNWLYYASVQ